MSLPQGNVGPAWLRQPVLDADGRVIGPVKATLSDDATQLLEWLAVTLPDGTTRLVPVIGAEEVDDGIQVPFTVEAVWAAPRTSYRRVDAFDERRLYSHYGIGYSTQTSVTGLPASLDPPHRKVIRAAGSRPATLAVAALALVLLLAARRWGNRR
jgi:hypothetical protein